MKKMSIRPRTDHKDKMVYDLLIERDCGNEVGILMGGKDQKKDWKRLKTLCEQVLSQLK